MFHINYWRLWRSGMSEAGWNNRKVRLLQKAYRRDLCTSWSVQVFYCHKSEKRWESDIRYTIMGEGSSMARPKERRLVTMTGLGGKGLGEYRAYLAQKQMFRSTEKEMCSKMQIPHNLHYVVNQKSGCICSKCPGDTVCTGTVLCKN